MKLVEDLGAPGLVTGVDLLTLEYKPTWNETAAYVMTGLGYVGGWLLTRGLGPISSDFLTKMGIASLPLTARNIYNRVKITGPVASTSRMALRRNTAAPVTRKYEAEFEGASSHVF